MSQPAQPIPKRVITVCVDDFGLHEGINRAALDLANLNRISAVSCLVEGPAWHSGAETLRENAARIEIGLHLNFTEELGQNLFWRPLPRLIALSYARRLDPLLIRQSITRQFELFEAAMGRPPDFVDGHQHVHQLPTIREVLIEVLDERRQPAKPWLRATHPPAGWPGHYLRWPAKFKSWLIGRLGAPALARLAREHGYPQNPHLLGVYGFDGEETDYLIRLGAWFKLAQGGDLLMCHPSLTGPWNDPLLQARHREYSVLSSDAFSGLMDSSGIEIGLLRGRSIQ